MPKTHTSPSPTPVEAKPAPAEWEYSPSRFVAAREAAGLTQADLAELMGKDRSQQGVISRYESTGTKGITPSVPTLKQVAEILKLHVPDVAEQGMDYFLVPKGTEEAVIIQVGATPEAAAV